MQLIYSIKMYRTSTLIYNDHRHIETLIAPFHFELTSCVNNNLAYHKIFIYIKWKENNTPYLFLNETIYKVKYKWYYI